MHFFGTLCVHTHTHIYTEGAKEMCIHFKKTVLKLQEVLRVVIVSVQTL